ncbi:MAG: DUF2225 domain-containing protein [Clostridia bacterium]|nr:DUF2225 domain-containing protein [Clostridia bacterium]MBP3422127.1 DUF2225 domain-containing protein [Clostridia bacterium]
MKIAETTVKCSFCQKESQQTALLSCSAFGAMDLDTRPAPMARYALAYEVQECPHCHYCNVAIDQRVAESFSFSSDYQAILHNESMAELPKRYYLTAILQEEYGDLAEAGMGYLRAAWCYDDESGMEEAANEARRHAARCFSQYVFEEEDGQAALILLDIFRRIGEREEALGLIDWIGETCKEMVDAIIRFQKRMIENGDRAAHTIDEVE